MKLLKKLWGWIRRDGLLHIESSTLLLLVLAAFMPLWLAVVLTVGAGIGKELWDRKHEGQVASWHDVICDLCGIALGVLLVLILYR